MAITNGQLFNFIQGSDITGQSAYDIWKGLGHEGSEADFLEFIRGGKKGDPASFYGLTVTDTVMKKGANNVLVPANVTFSAYYREGTNALRHSYNGRFTIQESVDGDIWETKYTSTEDESFKQYTPSSPDINIIRCILYAAEDNTLELDIQSVVIVADASSVEVGARNLLSNSDRRYTITNESIGVVDSISIVDGFKLHRLIGKKVALSYYVDAVGEFQSAELGDEDKFGMNAKLVWSDSTGVNESTITEIPFDTDSTGVIKDRVSFLWDIVAPEGYDTIDSLTFDILLTVKPSDTNNNVWIFERPKFEIGNVATEWTIAPEDIPRDTKEYTDEQIENALTEAKSYTDTTIENLIGAAPETLNTIEEVAKAIEEHQEVTEALDAAIGNKVNKAQGTENAGKVLIVGEDGNVTPGNIDSGSTVKDWNENDPISPKYIENRTHWAEVTAELLLDECEVSGSAILDLTDGPFYDNNRRFIVTLDGVTYICNSFINWCGEFCLGDSRLFEMPSDDGEEMIPDNSHPEDVPFIINVYEDWTSGGDFGWGDAWGDTTYEWWFYTGQEADDDTTHTLKIEIEGIDATYYPLDERFIPDTIARENELVDHTSNNAIHITSSERSTWNSMLDTAKAYTDEKIGDVDFSSIEEKIEELTKPKSFIVLKDIDNGQTYLVQMKSGNLVTSSGTASISITTPPNKMSYSEGDEFDPTGMVVTATCTDGSTRKVVDYSCKLDGNIVTITYVEGDTTFVTTLEVTYVVMKDLLQDFTYTKNADGTYTLTGWKQTLNGVASTEMIIPDNPKIIL